MESGPDILHGLCKVYKTIVDICSPFRFMLSAVRTPTHKLHRFLVPILQA